MKNLLIFFLFFAGLQYNYSQNFRSFLDIPSFYAVTNDLENASNDVGLGFDFAYGIGTHNTVAKLTAGIQATTNLDAPEILAATYYNPFAQAEVGVGLWRTNSNQCGSKQQRAYTAIAKGGIQYRFTDKNPDPTNGVLGRASGSYFFAGVELATFMYLDYRKNGEFFIDTGFFFKPENIYLKIGLRTFINTRA